MSNTVVMTTNIEGLPPPRRGKVRDIYETEEHLLIIATESASLYMADRQRENHQRLPR